RVLYGANWPKSRPAVGGVPRLHFSAFVGLVVSAGSGGCGGSLFNGAGGSGRERGGRLRSLPGHHLKGLHRYEAGSFYLFLGKTDIRKSSIPASSRGARGRHRSGCENRSSHIQPRTTAVKRGK